MSPATYSPTKINRIHKQKPLSKNVHMVLTDEELEMKLEILINKNQKYLTTNEFLDAIDGNLKKKLK